MAALRLALLGTFEARLASGSAVSFPRKKAEALLAYLALHPGQMQPRDKLAALLWGDASDERARHSLRQALVTLRQALPRAAVVCLVEEGDMVGVNPVALEADVSLFEQLAVHGTPESLEGAAALYRGDLLEGITIDESAFEEWLRTERERLREVAIDTLARLLGHQAAIGALDQAVKTAVRLLGLDPTQEPVHRMLMRLHARQARRGAALRQYQVCVGVLERELGVEPEPETKQLYRDLLQAQAPTSPPPAQLRRAAHLITSDTALIGRAVELATLRERLDDAWRGHGRIGVIQGEAGIGKTRLVEALITEAIDRGAQILLGRAHEGEQVLPLGPWVDAFRRGCIVPDLVEKLDWVWRRELARLFPELDPPGREPTTGEDYVRLFEAMARTVQHLGSPHPLLIVLEDLHWTDEMTLRLLVFLGRRLQDWPVLVTGTLRLEDLADMPILRRTIGQLGHQPGFFSITLGPLAQAETVALVRSLVKAGTDDAVVQRLGEGTWRASEGNPFMVLETVRALQGRETEIADVLVTPERVRDVISARLDRLSERGRRLAGVAGVIGREFEFALLERAAELAVADTAEGLEELVGRRILHAVGERFDFTHERIREVTYDALLPSYRMRLHEATARALEGLYGADLAPHVLALGRHYYASEAWDPASRYLSQAGTSAAARGAHREAVACFEQALDALRRLPASREIVVRAIDLRFDVRNSCVPLRDHRRILGHLFETESAARSIGDRRRLGWTLAYRAHGLYLEGDSFGAIDAGEQALAVAAELDDPMLEEWANVSVAQVYHWVGNYRAAVNRLGQNVESLEDRLVRIGLAPKQFVNTRMLLAWCLAELGDFTEARARAAEAIATAEQSDSAYWLVHAYSGAGLADLRRGASDLAIPAAERALELCQGRDYFALWGIPATILGGAYALAGRHADAIPLLESAVEIGGVLGAPVLVFLGQAYLAADRLTDAQLIANRALALAVGRRERGWEAWARWLLAEAAAASGSSQGAYREALVLAEKLGMKPLVAHCHRGLDGVYRRLGKPQTADEHRTRAIAMYRDLQMTYSVDSAS